MLTGPEPLSQAEQVRIIGEVIGRDVPFEELTPDEFRQETAGTWPPAAVEMLLAAWGATIGTPAHVTTTVADVLGRRRVLALGSILMIFSGASPSLGSATEKEHR